MSKELERFIPPELVREPAKIKIDEGMAPIIDRINEYLPSDQVWKNFSSVPGETRGVRQFPFCRADMILISCRTNLYLIENDCLDTAEEERECYEKASRAAMRAVLWIEVGFEGLQI